MSSKGDNGDKANGPRNFLISHETLHPYLINEDLNCVK
jgi:hypothetical protein